MNARAFRGRTAILVLSAAGALACLGLELVHHRAYTAPGADAFCAFGERLDCNVVALSRFAVLLGVPLPVWGLVGFVALGLAAWQRSRWLLPLAFAATLAGVVLTGVSAWGVGAFCSWCEATHLISLAILVITWRARHALAGPLWSFDAVFAFLPALGLLLAARLFVPPYWAVFTWKSELPAAHGRTEDGHPWLGAEQPVLTLHEFVDYSCPHCRLASARTLARLAAHPTELRIVRRHYPLAMCHPRSEARCLAVRIAFCADEQERFWQADRWLFEHAAGGRQPEVARAARDLELDPVRLSSCVASDATFERAVATWKQAKKLRIPGTPYYLSGDRTVTAAGALALIDAL